MKHESQPIPFDPQPFYKKIAALNNIDVADIKNSELGIIHLAQQKARNTTGWQKDLTMRAVAPLVDKYVGGSTSKREVMEKIQQFGHLTEIILDTHTMFTSYGTYIPGFHFSLVEQREKTPHNNHTSLLIGAMTQEGIEEYAKTVKTIHPDASCSVIDIEGVTTAAIDKKTAKFVYGSGVAIPFADNTFMSIHTNYLWPSLLNNSIDKEETFRQMLSEVHRVLAPNGVMLAAEPLGIFSVDELRDQITNYPFQFRKGNMMPPMKFISKRDMVAYPTFPKRAIAGRDEVFLMLQK